ncbi:unnamed protein product [Ostreobium quekettii]|uniref:DUF7912 domain-containing protein n=1 Tax=Ostreobium quekettii TaxID=121088 RepID=A0A8S1J963_9CHLO|nr:unnamed protein product [Ostreobium quekettii]|eukprot:evm.model.scf_119EXC.13 EVM.evm.TU.scf_119EXC.13   scf_119EXC:90835-91947(+)
MAHQVVYRQLLASRHRLNGLFSAVAHRGAAALSGRDSYIGQQLCTVHGIPSAGPAARVSASNGEPLEGLCDDDDKEYLVWGHEDTGDGEANSVMTLQPEENQDDDRLVGDNAGLNGDEHGKSRMRQGGSAIPSEDPGSNLVQDGFSSHVVPQSSGRSQDAQSSGSGTGDEESLEPIEQPTVPGVKDTEGTEWGQVVLEIVREVLKLSRMSALRLYSFHAEALGNKVSIRLDKTSDMYGSPNLIEIEDFSRAVYTRMESRMGVDEAGNVALEVSSPGAERRVIVPDELDRFKELPMTVEFTDESGSIKKEIFNFVRIGDSAPDEDAIVWKFADVRVHRARNRGRGMSKKEMRQTHTLFVRNIRAVHLYLDL